MGFKLNRTKKTTKEIDNDDLKFGLRLIEFIGPVVILAGIILILRGYMKTVTPSDIEVIRGFVASGTPFEFLCAFFLLSSLVMIFTYMLTYPLSRWLVFKLTGGSLQEREIKRFEAYQG